MSKFLISGANGYIGKNLINTLKEEGFQVAALGRAPVGIKSIPWRLGDFCSEGCFNEYDCFVHLAHSWDQPELNFLGTAKLLESFRKSKCRRFIFASTVSATSQTSSAYGAMKYAIEQQLLGPAEFILRIGLVYGGLEGGLWQQLKRISNFPIIPVLGADQPVYPITMANLTSSIQQAATGKDVRKLNYACNSSSIRFDDFLMLSAIASSGRRSLQIRIPNRSLQVMEKFFGWLLPARFRDRIRGIVNLSYIPKGEGVTSLTVAEHGLFEKNKNINKQILYEGYFLLKYLSGGAPSITALKCYCRIVRKYYLGIPGRFSLLPFRLWLSGIFWEPIRNTNADITSKSRRLELAYQISCFEKKSRSKYYPNNKFFSLKFGLKFTVFLLLEATALIPRFISKIIWQR